MTKDAFDESINRLLDRVSNSVVCQRCWKRFVNHNELSAHQCIAWQPGDYD